jgi:hypothetical protein
MQMATSPNGGILVNAGACSMLFTRLHPCPLLHSMPNKCLTSLHVALSRRLTAQGRPDGRLASWRGKIHSNRHRPLSFWRFSRQPDISSHKSAGRGGWVGVRNYELDSGWQPGGAFKSPPAT